MQQENVTDKEFLELYEKICKKSTNNGIATRECVAMEFLKIFKEKPGKRNAKNIKKLEPILKAINAWKFVDEEILNKYI
ncbi:hypothetical protein SAMN02745784_02981 [Tissierella praeacuta DSM 18095]|uniref:Uncharacterized protein n=1 Tax=Tissierella praeacuta DSM 18095 TaxID=1123404 RepID=A0A1M4ZAY5_9FIRM|nr:hypothetical protein [Tissierella praeacuta]TCU74243.1 hypothetical protein EV204_104281 [Tissierella praeacuta]SHF15203.1 hypothetical protein SAMN02745784_02981 [Tissierella praeacuta DSM 18095]SUO99535.1 Uncharacterised protein [Tissierella praeacuta]